MQQKQEGTALVWFGNNLRIRDNNSLALATQNHDRVIAIYCFNPEHFKIDQFGFRKTEKFRAQFLIETIRNLKLDLNAHNISLLTYFDSPHNIVPKLCKTYQVSSVYLQKEWTSEEKLVLDLVKKACPSNIGFIETYDQFLYHPDTVSRNFEKIPNVFTAFRKKLEKYVDIKEKSKPLIVLEKSNKTEEDTAIPNLSVLGFDEFSIPVHSAFPFKGGETEGLKRVHYYLFESKKVSYYKKTRNGLIGVDYSTKFSPWLANGSLSAKTIYWEVKKYEQQFGKNQSTYWVIFELIWRDFFKYISLKYGNAIFKVGGILERNYEWNNNQESIQSWINGTTNDDFVNANMIELKETGWMSNRGRQNVASYFAKELLLDWRIGAAYFESILLDYDVHSNYGNWMYVAGVGNDPRDRKFNTQLQAERYDTNYKFRKMWLEQTLF